MFVLLATLAKLPVGEGRLEGEGIATRDLNSVEQPKSICQSLFRSGRSLVCERCVRAEGFSTY